MSNNTFKDFFNWNLLNFNNFHFSSHIHNNLEEKEKSISHQKKKKKLEKSKTLDIRTVHVKDNLICWRNCFV